MAPATQNNDLLNEQISSNYRAFQKVIYPNLDASYTGKYVVLKDGEMIQAFDTARDAVLFGQAEYPDGLFSIQHVSTVVVDQGYFQHAVSTSNL